STNRYTSHRPPIQVGPLGRWRLVSPRKPGLPLASARAGKMLTRRSRRRHFPLSLGRQSSAGPTAKCLGLIPAHMDDRQVFFERYPLVKMPAAPSSALGPLPVNRMLGIHLISPAPPSLAPILFK